MRILHNKYHHVLLLNIHIFAKLLSATNYKKDLLFNIIIPNILKVRIHRINFLCFCRTFLSKCTLSFLP